MKVYHRTASPEAILATGFKDNHRSRNAIIHGWSGIFVSPEPLTICEGAKGETVLSMEIAESLFCEHEIIEVGKPYREAVIPAEKLNASATPVIHDDDWKGCTRDGMLRIAESYESHGRLQEAERIRGKIPFLEAYGLLGKDAEQ